MHSVSPSDAHLSTGRLGGTGLGLAIVKHIVSALRGTVSFESSVGVGGTFSIVLPASLSETLDITAQSFANPSPWPRKKCPHFSNDSEATLRTL